MSLVDVLQLSKGGEPYEWVCSKLLPCVVGVKNWKLGYLKEPISDVATCSDEAFLLLVLENNYSRWLSEARWLKANRYKDEEAQAPKNYPEAKYTNSGRSKKNGRSKRNQGWSREGYVRFNELYSLVHADRLQRAKFEQELMIYMRQEIEGEDNSDDDIEGADDEIYPANDLLGAKDPTVVAGTPLQQEQVRDQYDPYRE